MTPKTRWLWIVGNRLGPGACASPSLPLGLSLQVVTKQKKAEEPEKVTSPSEEVDGRKGLEKDEACAPEMTVREHWLHLCPLGGQKGL